MLDVRFFKNPRFSAASIAITLVFFAMFGSLFFLTQYLQFVLGYSALKAGAALIPVAVGADHRRAAEREPRRAPRDEDRRDRGAAHRRRAGSSCCPRATTTSGYGLIALVLVDHRHRHGHRDGAGDGLDHGFAAARQGRRRFGRERHDARDRRRARHRRARQHHRVGVPGAHRRIVRRAADRAGGWRAGRGRRARDPGLDRRRRAGDPTTLRARTGGHRSRRHRARGHRGVERRVRARDGRAPSSSVR